MLSSSCLVHCGRFRRDLFWVSCFSLPAVSPLFPSSDLLNCFSDSKSIYFYSSSKCWKWKKLPHLYKSSWSSITMCVKQKFHTSRLLCHTYPFTFAAIFSQSPRTAAPVLSISQLPLVNRVKKSRLHYAPEGRDGCKYRVH